MNIFKIIDGLEIEWDEDGFFSRLREGDFSEKKALSVINFLKEIKIDEDEMVPKRALSLLWYLPSFLDWQKVRVSERGGDVAAYNKFIVDVRNALETTLGVP